jgi:hypothetical protein
MHTCLGALYGSALIGVDGDAPSPALAARRLPHARGNG